MAVKARKDTKGYALRTGECQRKDGRYSYSYTDRNGIRHSIYAKTLVDLRTREKKLQRDYDDGLDPVKAARLTLNHVYDRYISQKYDLKATTKNNYVYMYNRCVRETFGKRKIQQIRYSDVRAFYYSILKEKQMKSRLVLQVHDELLIEAYASEVDEVCNILKNEMANAATLSVPLEIDVHTGKNWYKAK